MKPKKKISKQNEIDIKLNPVRLIEIELSESFSYTLAYIREKIHEIRREIVCKFGFVPPDIPVFENIDFEKDGFVIKLEDLEVAREYVTGGSFLATGPHSFVEELKGQEGRGPDGQVGKWIHPDSRRKALEQGCSVYSPEEFLLEHLRGITFKNVHRLLGLEETKKLLDDIRDSHPVLVEALVPGIFSLMEIRRILKRLLMEKVSLRPLISILEALGDYCHITRDSDRLNEYVRQTLASYICKDYKDEDNTIRVMTADPRMERILLKGLIKTDEGMIMELDPEIRRNLRESLAENIDKFRIMELRPVLLSSPETRLHIKRLSERVFPDLVVLSVEEIPPYIKTLPLGIVSIEDAEAYIESGDQYYRENRLELAESEYIRAVELDPKNARAHYALRLTYRKMGKLEMALNSYRRAIELDPKYEFIDLQLRDENEDFPVGIQEDVIAGLEGDKNDNKEKLSPEELQIIIDSPSRKRTKDTPRIEESVYINQERIEKMKRLNPSFATIFNKMGEEHQSLKNYEAATKEFNKAVELDPGYAVPHVNLGKIYFEQQEWFLCRKSFEKAIELNPEYLEAYFYLGKLFKQRNMKDKAEQAFYRAWEIATKNSDMEFRENIKRELEQLKSK